MQKYLAFLTVFLAGSVAWAEVGNLSSHRCGTEDLPFTGPSKRTARGGGGGLVPERRTIFLNRQGGTYIPGNNEDARTNESTIVESPSTLTASQFSDGDWAILMGCVRDTFADFSVVITDVEPSPDTTYIESVVAGEFGELDRLGEDDGFAGVAPRTCLPIDRCINYSIAGLHCIQSPCDMDQLLSLCWTIAQETGHCLGMEHEYLASDPMTYLGGSLPKRFQNQDARCGESMEGACGCSTDGTQNTYAHLSDALGRYEEVDPTVSITEPADGATVPPRFFVRVDAADADPGRVDRVELYDGATFVTTDPEAQFTFNPMLGVGPHTLRVRAVDGNENFAETMITVNVEAECGDGAECPEGRACLEGACLADIGTSCELETDCITGLCYVDTGAQTAVCSQDCDPGDSGSCPGGFKCTEVQFGLPKCLKGGDSGGCGCVAGGRAQGLLGGGLAVAMLLAFTAYFRARRGRRA